MFRRLIVSTATIGLSAALMAAPAVADHKDNHNPGGGGGGGGDATFDLTLTNTGDGAVIASGDGVEGRGGVIEGITEAGSFEDIALGWISTPSGDVQADYNDLCSDVVNAIAAMEAIDSIEVMHNAEIDTLTVVTEYTVEGQSFTLLLDGPLGFAAEFPPTAVTDYGLERWNNRGGGKGKNNRCGSGFQNLDGGVTLSVVPQ